MERPVMASIEAEFRRYRTVAEGALAQLTDSELVERGPGGAPSPATIAWHIAGNLRSRFTEFLSSDGEKPWRDRESEFGDRNIPRAELMGWWDQGWTILFRTLDSLEDIRLHHEVLLKGDPLPVHEALHRALAHISYHVGQLVYLGRLYRGEDWRYLSVPPVRETEADGETGAT